MPVRIVIFGLLLLLAACGGADLSAEITPPPTPVATTTNPAHDFSLQTLDGDVLTLSEQRGQWVLVNFWASWCAPCVKEMPYLQDVADRGDILVWGINMREPLSDLSPFVETLRIRFPILLSPDDATILAYRGALPRTYLIAPDGSLAETIFGPIDADAFEAWLTKNVAP